MSGSHKKIAAATISIRETLDLLDGPFEEVAKGVARANYALWLGSGISRERVDDLGAIVRRVLNYLSSKARVESGEGPYNRALHKALGFALTTDETQKLDLHAEPANWPNIAAITDRLVREYSQLLDVRIQGEVADHLLWEVVDVRQTYASDALEPDCEHMAIALLAVEGVFPKIATANWDGLIEKAVSLITDGNPAILAVIVRAQDMPGANGRSFIHKFHGCAVRAKSDEGTYREYIVGRKQQITDWPNDSKFALMKNQLEGMSATMNTLMVGLSSQDSNIQHIFSVGRGMLKWPWPSHPPAYVFAEEELGADQGTMLKSVYKDEYDANQLAIENEAKIPAYGKSLLSALVLSILEQKCSMLIQLADAPNFKSADRSKVSTHVNELRNVIAETAVNTSSGKRQWMHSLIAGLTRSLAIFRGDLEAEAKKIYRSVSVFPLALMANDPNLQNSGMRELAVMVGIIGLGRSEDGWTVSLPLGELKQGSALISSPASHKPRRLFAVSSYETLSKLIGDGVIDESDENAIVAVCSAPVTRLQRNPLAVYGRGGDDATPNQREFSVKALTLEATGADHLLARFKEEATI